MTKTVTEHKVDLFRQAHYCLMATDPAEKAAAVQALQGECHDAGYYLDAHEAVADTDSPGSPGKPVLVEPAGLPRRRLGTNRGRAALVHAIAHIEFNAINLALDALYRFRGMPGRYYVDWLSVAVDESRHFQMLDRRLAQMGYGYGDFPAHNGLWQMAVRTGHDCMVRMALVPRVLEARGLDVTPGMIARLEATGDTETVGILRIILEEEIGHVRIGSRWFAWWCARRKLDPGQTFIDLLQKYYAGGVRGPFNHAARLDAGFSDAELKSLETLGRPAG